MGRVDLRRVTMSKSKNKNDRVGASDWQGGLNSAECSLVSQKQSEAHVGASKSQIKPNNYATDFDQPADDPRLRIRRR